MAKNVQNSPILEKMIFCFSVEFEIHFSSIQYPILFGFSKTRNRILCISWFRFRPFGKFLPQSNFEIDHLWILESVLGLNFGIEEFDIGIGSPNLHSHLLMGTDLPLRICYNYYLAIQCSLRMKLQTAHFPFMVLNSARTRFSPLGIVCFSYKISLGRIEKIPLFDFPPLGGYFSSSCI